jgi:hypothetical protein
MQVQPRIPQPLTIKESKVLLVEGNDEVQFFDALLRHMGILGVQVVEIGGKDRFPRQFEAFVKVADRVNDYAVIRDADKSCSSAFQSVVGVLKKQREPCPKRPGTFCKSRGNRRKVGVYILPGNAEPGMLENLCLATVKAHPAMTCVNSFMACLEKRLHRKRAKAALLPAKSVFPRNPAKAKALAFLAAMPDEEHFVGLAARHNCWNLDSPVLENLRTFLEEFK